MSVKKAFLFLSLIIIASFYEKTEAACKPFNKLSEEEKNRIDGTGQYARVISKMESNSVYDISGLLAGSAEGFIYRYYGGTDWSIVSPDLGGAVLCLVNYHNTIYAGTRDGKVWKASPGIGTWTETMFPVGQEPGQVNALIEYRGKLYAGTGYGSPYLFSLSDSNQWEFVTTANGFAGVRSLYVYDDILFLGDIAEDRFGHYDGNEYVYDGYFGVSCIWDFQEYHNHLYASSYAGDVYRLHEPLPNSPALFDWETIRQPDGYDTWELETFQDLLYVSHCGDLLAYDGNTFSGPKIVIPNENKIIAMLTSNDGQNLFIGVGQEMGAGEGCTGTVGRIYLYNGAELISISGEIGAGIQCFIDSTAMTGINLTKSDDVNDGDCVGPGREINYTIDYNYPSGPNVPDINDVNLIDNLPAEVDFVSADSNGFYDAGSRTVTWNLGIIHPGGTGSVTLKVKVKCPQPSSTITNECEIRSSGQILRSANEYTPVCSWYPTLTKVDNVTGCVGPGTNITYSICYTAHGYSDTNVVVVDTLPTEVDFVSATGGGLYNSGHVTWNIGTMDPNESGCVTVTVRVKCVMPGSTITNSCQMSGDCIIIPISAVENTLVCSAPTLTKVDNVTGCIGPDENVNYTICYNAHGYGDTNVMITDHLPNEVNYISSVPAGTYNHDTNTVVWNIDFPSDACGCIELAVQVKHNAIQDSTITNYCELKGNCVDINTHETISVCYPIYVDISATGANNGNSWVDAFTNLQDALKAAKDFNCNEILVAQGTYRPDVNLAYPSGSGDREATFQLIDGVTLYGGFPAGGGTLEDRKPSVYETILSGDLLGNDRQVAEPCDLLNDPCRADNSYHVVTGSGVTQTATLDGFTITGGDANDTDYYVHTNGGGMTSYTCDSSYNCYYGNPTVRNCKFIRNAAQAGGGIYLYSNSEDSNATITNCTLIENSATGNYDYYGYYNSGYGGGICCSSFWGDSNPVISSCLFNNNWADQGGGIAIGYGGAAYVTNCTFIGNSASPGYYDYYGYYHYPGGGGIGRFPDGCNVSVKVTNCILWGNEGGQISGYYIDATVTYSDIQGGWEGIGNIENYPMFEADGYHLKMCSPCIDAGTNTPIGDLPATDIDGQARIMSGQCDGEAIVDMGADEYLPDCNAMLYAHCQSPTCRATAGLYVGESPDVNITWCSGRFAASHDVYFGTDYSGVYNATTSTPVIYKGRQSNPNYLATGLGAGNTYYWRVDEVNNTNIWRGPVRSFTTGLIIDDFERYNSTADLQAKWETTYLPNPAGYCGEYAPGVEVTNGVVTLVNDADGKHMRFHYYDEAGGGPTQDGALWFSEAKYEYGSNSADWTAGPDGNEPNMLVISYKGAISNSVDPVHDRMYVAIQDTAGNIGVYYNPDTNAAQVTIWTQWYITLKDINSAGDPHPVKLTAVSAFYLGFGVRCDYQFVGGGDGDVMFDNIRLEPPVIQGYGLAADFTGDCFVNFNDFAVMGDQWHSCGKTDLNHDCFVDIIDLAALAEEWLK